MGQEIHEDTVVESLKYILLKKDTNIHRLAKDMGWTSARLYKKFNHGPITLNDLDEICKALGVTYKVMFDLNDDEQK